MRTLAMLVLAAIACRAAEDLPVTGISHVAIRVSDIEKARAFYTGVLGIPEAFTLPHKDGTLGIAFLQVNDDQVIELQPGLPAGENLRMTHVALVTTDAAKLHNMLTGIGLKPTELHPPGADGNITFRVPDPEGNPLEFTQYLPGSLHTKARGKFPSDRRISNHLRHAGVLIHDLDKEVHFYRDQLGFVETWRSEAKEGEGQVVDLRLPGNNTDYLEFIVLKSAEPTREERSEVQHVGLESADVHAAYRTVVSRGYKDVTGKRPAVGADGHWAFNLYDPDGSRIEVRDGKAAKP